MTSAHRTSYAVLGLLSQGPKSDYEIKQVVEEAIGHFWKESYGHLYPALSRLMAEGLVRREAEGGRHTWERQRYHLTESGRAVLEAWFSVPVEPEGTRNELALKLYFGQSAPPVVSRAHLEMHREHHCHLLARYAEDQPELEARANAGEPGALRRLRHWRRAFAHPTRSVALGDIAAPLVSMITHSGMRIHSIQTGVLAIKRPPASAARPRCACYRSCSTRHQ